MAANSSTDADVGAAEEPEHDVSPRVDSSNTTDNCSLPHADVDRGNPSGGGIGCKHEDVAAKPPGKSNAHSKKAHSKKAKGDVSHRCANCDKPCASKCGQCGVEWYCGRKCQKVRGE